MCNSQIAISCYSTNTFWGLPDNRAPYVIIYTGAQLSGSGAQLAGPGAQLSGLGAQLSAILVCIPMYTLYLRPCVVGKKRDHFFHLWGCPNFPTNQLSDFTPIIIFDPMDLSWGNFFPLAAGIISSFYEGLMSFQ